MPEPSSSVLSRASAGVGASSPAPCCCGSSWSWNCRRRSRWARMVLAAHLACRRMVPSSSFLATGPFMAAGDSFGLSGLGQPARGEDERVGGRSED
jgi:hypothetical protein